MNYKRIIKSQELRFKILDLFNFMSDEQMIKLQYRIKTGRKLNLKNPQRYTEKLQWYKLNYRDPLMVQCSDKYGVRSYVENKGLGRILNTLYGVYSNADEIDFESLPNSFAIKVTNGSGTNIFIEDKTKMNIDLVKKQIDDWMHLKHCSYGREWSYYNVPPRIIIEKLIKRDSNNDLPDYKFFCFHGKVHCLYTMIDYVDNHDNGKLGFYDTEFNQLPYRRLDFGEIKEKLNKPKNFDEMLKIASKLSEDFPHVRVDLYNIDGEILFGELTFYNASGYTKFYPDEFDYILGAQFSLPERLNGDCE
ncbi:ATP-grasp fold amidoligase family protein [Bacillus pacificus]|uniref:ATP-grasp fold amidoligase family protein n=1 Tax=Bacillus cereus group TaxID=86661 RepID=UPI0007722E2E|nr:MULTISPECIES: ATP-grasp fold amidoligase family protein [Bacillus cereus group]KXI45541.1 hypothetical protein ACS95_28065 [Bacillus cereus]MDA2770684.1 ATP-grasp fold amidoligase family protein [Bacillus cereus group sp. Bc010]MED1443881.1 ATP-grasp fold amidoligase family protein [Bacillus pacificus]